MLLGALIDAGASVDALNGALSSLGVTSLSIAARTDGRGGVTGTRVEVEFDATEPSRRIQDFIRIVDESDLSPKAADRVRTILHRLGKAEAAVHRVPPDEVHLHELGTLDTLADVVGVVLGLDMLGIERVYSSPLPTGSGVAKTDHGPVPALAPATAALLAEVGAPVVAPPGGTQQAGEMVTPTGAAIVTSLARFRQPAMDLERVGYGLGARESDDYPNVVALWLGEALDLTYNDSLSLIETNIDDMSAELLAYVQESLFESGARDVWFTPIQMKKNRPATMLSALVPADMESQAATLVLRETSSLGVRVRQVSRYEAEREEIEVDTSLGKARVKVKSLQGARVAVSPEYEDCRRIAKELGMTLQDVYLTIQSEAGAKLLTIA